MAEYPISEDSARTGTINNLHGQRNPVADPAKAAENFLKTISEFTTETQNEAIEIIVRSTVMGRLKDAEILKQKAESLTVAAKDLKERVDFAAPPKATVNMDTVYQ